MTPCHRIAFVGSYVPRRCGIATFTRDLRAAVAEASAADCPVVAIDEPAAGHRYPPEVRLECGEAEPAAYRQAADFLNLANADVVSLQHEFGIFGGVAGDQVLQLVRRLRVPLHTTLHTVLESPDADQRRVLCELFERSARLVVMSRHGREMLVDRHGVSPGKIDLIPHGIPDTPFEDAATHKPRFGVEGRRVLATFGLLSPNKGIEQVIEAMPTILERHPDTVYLVLGATHPRLVASEGERYREELLALADSAGVARQVRLFDRYVAMPELLAFIGCCDIYLTPYLNPAQVVSGTLAYAFGCGKAVISTPYWHAAELLGEGRGVLVPFGDPDAIAREVCGLFDEPRRLEAMRRRSYAAGREMIWSRVALRYLESFAEARGTSGRPWSRRPRRVVGPLPRIRLRHLRRLTDPTGILQHASHQVPRYEEGYCTDDNARALTLMVQLESLAGRGPRLDALAIRYAGFLDHAFDRDSGRFRNFLSFARVWLDDLGSDDCLGRSVQALGVCLGRSRRQTLRNWAMPLFGPAVAAAVAATSPRGWAFTILGIDAYLERFPGDRWARRQAELLAGRMLDGHRGLATADWCWPEEIVAYDNPRLCQALIACGRRLGCREMLACGLAMLDWLDAVQQAEAGQFRPVGSRGFYHRGGSPSRFDQQPLEAGGMVAAAIEAFRCTGEDRWRARAWAAFDWFLGRNDLGEPLADVSSGGCRDGLLPDRVNENRGAESTLAYLQAVTEMTRFELQRKAIDSAMRPKARGAIHGKP